MGFRVFKFPNIGSAYIPKAHIPRIKAKFRVRVTNRGHRIVDYMQKWENQFLRRAGASIRTYIIRGFKVVSDKNSSSPAGSAPHLHMPKVAFIKGAVQYKVDYQRRRTIVGTAYSVAKLWGWKHEHGKKFGRGGSSKGTMTAAQYPKRPFVEPQFRRWWRIGRPAIMYSIRQQIKSSL